MAPHQAPPADQHHDRANTPGTSENIQKAVPSEILLDVLQPLGGLTDQFEDFIEPDAAHPRNNSVPIADLPGYSDSPVEFDTAGNRYENGRRQFDKGNGEAFPVFERASSDFTTGAIFVNSWNGGTVIVVGRQKGRKALTLWVPTSIVPPGSTTPITPSGVLFAQTEGELQNGGGAQINPGDSLTIETEAPVWCGLIPGSTSGVVQFTTVYNPGGGELGGQ
jgi:hypothetical protein